MIKIQNLSKSFKANHVFSNVNMNIERGEIVHLVGSNGCGKSTLLKIIAGLLKKDAGEIEMDQDVKIGALIENPSFVEDETLLFNLKFLYELTKPFDQQAYDHIKNLTQSLDLDMNSKVKMKEYSVGMRQKSGIIQAIMENQTLILLDEPTRGLDKSSVVAFTETVNALLEEGKSIIIAAHDDIEGIHFNKTYEFDHGTVVQK